MPAILICLGIFFLTISFGKSAGLNQTLINALCFVFFIVVFVLSGINVVNSFKRARAHFFGHPNTDESKETKEK